VRRSWVSAEQYLLAQPLSRYLAVFFLDFDADGPILTDAAISLSHRQKTSAHLAQAGSASISYAASPESPTISALL